MKKIGIISMKKVNYYNVKGINKMVSDLKKEREKFIQDLKELDEVKEIKKINLTNIFIYFLLIFFIPLLFLLGFFLKINIICIISIIVLMVLLIYTCWNNYKCKKIVIEIIKDRVTEFFRSKYGEIKLKEEKKDDICEKNNELIARNCALEEMNRLTIYKDIYTDYLIRFNDGKEYIDMLYYKDDKYGYKMKHFEYCNFILVTKFREDGVLCLKSINKNNISKKNREIFDMCFYYNEDAMKEVLEKIEESKKPKKYIELTESQKQKLLEIFNKYSSRFTIVIIDGYLFIKSKKLIGRYSNELNDIFDVQNCLDEVLKVVNRDVLF